MTTRPRQNRYQRSNGMPPPTEWHEVTDWMAYAKNQLLPLCNYNAIADVKH